MISYIRHDDQFYGTMKLTTGEEILGEILVTEDPETKTDLSLYNILLRLRL